MQGWLFLGILLLMILLIFLIILKRVQNRKQFSFIFLIGLMGWTAAFILRLPLLNIIENNILVFLGANLNDPASIAQFSNNIWLQIWGPLFAGLFEETARFICIYIYMPIRNDRKNSPLMLGLGWTTAEILVITLLAWTSDFSVWAIIERIGASIFHITMCYVIVYAVFEFEKKKPSLWLAIVFHIISDGLIVIWSQFGQNLLILNPSLFISAEEISFLIWDILCVLFTWLYWIPRSEKKIKYLEQTQQTPPEETTKDNIKIEKIL